MDEGTAGEGGDRKIEGVFSGEENMEVIIYSKPAAIAKSMCCGGMLISW